MRKERNGHVGNIKGVIGRDLLLSGFFSGFDAGLGTVALTSRMGNWVASGGMRTSPQNKHKERYTRKKKTRMEQHEPRDGEQQDPFQNGCRRTPFVSTSEYYMDVYGRI